MSEDQVAALMADRDRLLKAITEALEPKNIDYGHIYIALERVERILRDAIEEREYPNE